MDISFQSDNNLLASLVVTIFILVVIGIIYSIIRHKDRVQEIILKSRHFLSGPASLLIFAITRILIGLAGVVTLIATVFPGVISFKEYANQNLELGGLVFFFIWPFIILQIAAAFLPYPNKLISTNPIVAWSILVIAGFIAINIDIMAIGILYKF